MTVDSAGNSYMTGSFMGTVDFDPDSINIHNMTAAAGWDIFVCKLDTSGNFLWAQSFGGTNYDYGRCITIDHSGSVFISGDFLGTVDFNYDSTNVYNLTSYGGTTDIFILKLTSTGDFIWARSIYGSGNERNFSMTNDLAGNLYYTGQFSAVTDFDPGAAVFNLSWVGGADVFLSKLNSGGDFVWAKAIGGTANDEAFDIALDASSAIYITGIFTTTADFDPDTGQFLLTPYLHRSIFISRFDSSGKFTWVNQIDGSSIEVYNYSIAVSPPGYLYSFGYFASNQLILNSTILTNASTSTFSSDIFIAKLDTLFFTGLNEMDKSRAQVYLYPNPAKNKLHIVFGNTMKEITINIMDMSGRILKNDHVTSGEKVEIDINNFTAGLYLVKVNSGDLNEIRKLILE
jgi:hypothetical protein